MNVYLAEACDFYGGPRVAIWPARRVEVEGAVVYVTGTETRARFVHENEFATMAEAREYCAQYFDGVAARFAAKAAELRAIEPQGVGSL